MMTRSKQNYMANAMSQEKKEWWPNIASTMYVSCAPLNQGCSFLYNKLLLKSLVVNWYSIRFRIPIENGKGRKCKENEQKTIGNERYIRVECCRPPLYTLLNKWFCEKWMSRIGIEIYMISVSNHPSFSTAWSVSIRNILNLLSIFMLWCNKNILMRLPCKIIWFGTLK